MFECYQCLDTGSVTNVLIQNCHRCPETSQVSLESIVTDYIIEKFAPDLAGEDLPNDMNLQETGIVTSIGLVQIIGWCGEKFQIPIAARNSSRLASIFMVP